jgi:hypothetical protein
VGLLAYVEAVMEDVVFEMEFREDTFSRQLGD